MSEIFLLTFVIVVVLRITSIGFDVMKRRRERAARYVPPGVSTNPLVTEDITTLVERRIERERQMQDHMSNCKYAEDLMLAIDGEVVEFTVFADESIDIYGCVYYDGQGYYLYQNQDYNYQFDEDSDGRTDYVPAELLRAWPHINMKLCEFGLLENPKDPYWNIVTLHSLVKAEDEIGDVYSEVNLLFFCWYFRMEQHSIDPQFPRYLLIEHLHADPVGWFEEDAIYHFMLGWAISVTPYIFQTSPDEEGPEHLLAAHQLEPENPLYKWAASKQLGLSPEETRSLAMQVDASHFEGLIPPAQEYFMDMIEGNRQV